MIRWKTFRFAPVFLFVAFSSVATNAGTSTGSNRVDFDFSDRDRLPETNVPASDWHLFWGGWGPKPITYPKVVAPSGVDQSQWMHDRVVAVAEHYLGLAYAHRHIPQMGGLDCSNFTAWVYNFGFGIQLKSNVHVQSKTAGRKLAATETFQHGDLLFIWNRDKTIIAHVAIFIGNDQLIDSTKGQVAIRPFTGWYKTRFAWARRVIP